MEPIDLVVEGTRWRIRSGISGADVQEYAGKWWFRRADAASLPLLSMAIKEAGFRAVYPEAVGPLCKAIQQAIDAEDNYLRRTKYEWS